MPRAGCVPNGVVPSPVEESAAVGGRLMAIRTERGVMLGVWTLAALACLLGIADPPSLGSHATRGQEAMDLIRVLTTTALAIVLLFGPGVMVRALSERRIGLAVIPIPGLALLALTGLAAWLLAGTLDVKTTCFALLGPVLGLMLGILVGGDGRDLFEPEEQRTLVVTSLALALGIARSLWSLGPAGELYEGGISRTLVPEGRPDSRTSFLVTGLLANGAGPYAKGGGQLLFIPYNFSSRGPVAGMASAPIVLMSGARPPLGPPEYPWQPFDGQGFMAYRIAMMTFSCSAFLALWQLVRRLGGAKPARFAVLLAVSTPFLIDDLMFTWPKLIAAAFILLAAISVIERRPFRGGLSISAGYLVHPGALVGLLSLVPITIWPMRRPNWRRPRLLALVLLAIGSGIGVEAWKLYNGAHFMQSDFTEYVSWASVYNLHPSIAQWLEFRFASLAGTLVPMFTPIFHAHSAWNNKLFGISPGVVHFFDQYWTSLAFGLGILFYPLLLLSLWRAGRRWPWPILATVVFPLVIFTIYWGFDLTGLLREGLQYWVLVVIAVVALQQAASGYPWLRSVAVRLILCVRALEVFAILVGMTWGTRGFHLTSANYTLSDAVAMAAMMILTALLIALIWSDTGSRFGERRGLSSRAWGPGPAPRKQPGAGGPRHHRRAA